MNVHYEFHNIHDFESFFINLISNWNCYLGNPWLLGTEFSEPVSLLLFVFINILFYMLEWKIMFSSGFRGGFLFIFESFGVIIRGRTLLF